MTDQKENFLTGIRQDLTEVRLHIVWMILAFFLGSTLGVLYPERGEQLASGFAQMAARLRELGPLALIFAILLRNALAVGVALLLGAVLGLAPLFAALTNGLLVGYLLSQDPSGWWRLIPHGVFELPAVFIGWGAGLWLGMWPFRPPRLQTLKRRFGRAVRIYAVIVLPLLIVAAVIEALSAVLLYW